MKVANTTLALKLNEPYMLEFDCTTAGAHLGSSCVDGGSAKPLCKQAHVATTGGCNCAAGYCMHKFAGSLPGKELCTRNLGPPATCDGNFTSGSCRYAPCGAWRGSPTEVVCQQVRPYYFQVVS